MFACLFMCVCGATSGLAEDSLLAEPRESYVVPGWQAKQLCSLAWKGKFVGFGLLSLVNSKETEDGGNSGSGSE